MTRPPFTGQTAVYGIVGDPVAHSLSPLMHAHFAAGTGLDLAYVPFHVRGDAFATAVRGLAASGVQGVNVTVPHKEKALAFADESDSAAQAIGAANTLCFAAGKCSAHNTDAVGFSRALDDTGLDWRGRRALVLGAGGAARAVLYALAQAGAERIYLANRTLSRAEQLARDFAALPLRPVPLDKAALAPLLGEISLLINTSSRGLHGEEHPEIDFSCLPSTGIICDIVYNPIETALLYQARAHGLHTVDGLGMLIHQGAESFRLWTGIHPPLGAIRNTLEQWLASIPAANR